MTLIEHVRRFNRTATVFSRALGRSYLASPFSTVEARILWELAQAPARVADIQARLGLDQAFVSRVVARLEARGVVERRPAADKRSRSLHLTAGGASAFTELDALAAADVGAQLAHLGPAEQDKLVHAMDQVCSLLDEPGPVTLRPGRVGDVGWALQRQAELYQEEFGYLPVFERYVAMSIPPFLEHFDAERDRMWVAERGARVGCIAVHHDCDRPGWAKLRWYFVEAAARGSGLGKALVGEALDFCRKQYDGVHLWTCSDLLAARRQYERAGFVLAEEKECPWKPEVVQQRWDLTLVDQETCLAADGTRNE